MKRLSEEEIDERVIAEADNDAAWEMPIKVEPATQSSSETLHERAKDPLQNDPRFLKRIEAARQSLRAGRGVPLEEVPE